MVKGGYYDPPFKCRVPKCKKKRLPSYSPNVLKLARIEREIGEFLASFLFFCVINCIECTLLLLSVYRQKEVEKVSEIKKRLTITMSSNMYGELENLAKEMGLSKSALLTVAFEEFKQKKKGQKNT